MDMEEKEPMEETKPTGETKLRRKNTMLEWDERYELEEDVEFLCISNVIVYFTYIFLFGYWIGGW